MGESCAAGCVAISLLIDAESDRSHAAMNAERVDCGVLDVPPQAESPNEKEMMAARSAGPTRPTPEVKARPASKRH